MILLTISHYQFMSNKDENNSINCTGDYPGSFFLFRCIQKEEKKPETPVGPEPDVKDEKETKVSNN